MDRDAIGMLVPGGVPDMQERVGMVVELMSVAEREDEAQATRDICLRAARALFADYLAIGDA